MILNKILLLVTILKFFDAAELECPTVDDDSLIIDSLDGKIKGSCAILEINSESKKLFKWSSIPYAEPPIDANRFKAPIPIKPYTSILDATQAPNACMQLINKNVTSQLEFTKLFELAVDSSIKTSEDCLFLNIHAPIDEDYMIKKKPILFVIHGGDGTTGTGSLDIQEPSVFASMTNTIVVTFNYRLGIFGFLNINGEEDIAGNQGFLDQHLALKWISQNAHAFGGDKEKITIMGYGMTGSLFVGLHLMYKPSRELFRNAIIQSGSPVNLAENLLSKNAASKRAEDFIKTYYNCDSPKPFNCIKEINGFNLTLNSRLYLINHMSNKSILSSLKIKSLFWPIVDGKVFTESPLKAFRVGNYKKCSILVGFNANDGANLIPLQYGLLGNVSKLKKGDLKQHINFESLTTFVKKFYHYYPVFPMDRNSEKIWNIILNTYTNFTMKTFKNSKHKNTNYFYQLRTLLTDEGYACPTFKFLDYVSNDNRVYLYIYNHRITTSKYPFWYGVVNGDELASVFGQPFRKINANQRVSASAWLPFSTYNYTENDKKVSRDAMMRWANFIHNDNPNVKTTLNENDKFEKWPEFKKNASKQDNLYLSYIQNGTKIMKLHNSKHCNVWNNVIPSNIQ